MAVGSRARQGGPEALLPRPALGRRPKLSAAQKRLIPEFLWHGPEAYGFRGEAWTCARVAKVIEEEFGIRYHKDHVGRLLKELQWTPQVPVTRAIQRDEEAIRRWRDEVWPQLQQRARRERRVLVFEDESGFYYPGKKDHYKRVTTERPHPTGGSCPREGHGKGKLIRILFSVYFGGFRG